MRETGVSDGLVVFLSELYREVDIFYQFKAGDIAQGLLAVLAEDMGSVPSNSGSQSLVTPVPRIPMTSSGLLGH